MANEFKHKDPGAELTQAEFVAACGDGHIFACQATGDIVYASSATVLSKLARGAANTVLSMGGSCIPAWTASPSVTDLTIGGGCITLSAATDIDLLDNNASALSFDASGKTGIIDIVTTNCSEGVTMSGTLGVTGVLTATGGIELSHACQNTLTGSGGCLSIQGNVVYRAGGTDVPVADGGTGASTLTDGGVLLGSGTSAITAMAVLADGEMIVGDGTTDPVAESGATLRTSIGVGTGDSPQFTGIELSHACQNTLTGSGGVLSIQGNRIFHAGGTDIPVADGGTGASTFTANGILVGNGTSAIAVTATMATKGHLMVGDGSGVPSMLAVGNNCLVLTACSSEGTGVKWAAASAPTEASCGEMKCEATGTLFVPPDLVKYSPGVAKAWVQVPSNGSLGSPSAANSYNVASVTANSTGDRTIAFTACMDNTTYSVVSSAADDSNLSMRVGDYAQGSFNFKIYKGCTLIDKLGAVAAFGVLD